jgi:hypothetical protein
MKNTTVLLFTIFLILRINAQTIEPSLGIEKNTFQIELESIYGIQEEGSEKSTSWSIPSLLVRYGISNAIELQLNTPVIKEQLYYDEHLIHSLYKFDDIQVGLSINLWKQNKLFPETSLMYRAIVPVTIQLNLKNLGHVFSLNMSNSFDSKLTFSNNIGIATETNNQTTGFYITNLNYELNSKIHFFIENFGDFTSSEFISTNINFGVGYNFNSKVSVDFSMAKGIHHDLFYMGGILTYVFSTK